MTYVVMYGAGFAETATDYDEVISIINGLLKRDYDLKEIVVYECKKKLRVDVLLVEENEDV